MTEDELERTPEDDPTDAALPGFGAGDGDELDVDHGTQTLRDADEPESAAGMP